MKKDIHPKQRPVVFFDMSANKKFLCNSTAKSDKTTTFDDGLEYPVVYLDISSASHPVFTGKVRAVAAEGRVAKFQNKFKLKTG